jgi:hypothetical protein
VVFKTLRNWTEEEGHIRVPACLEAEVK